MPVFCGEWKEVMPRKMSPFKDPAFTALVDCCPDGMVVFGPDGRIVIANCQTENLFGYGRNELLHQPIEVLVPEGLRQAHQKQRPGLLHAPTVRPAGTRLARTGLRKDGTEFPVEISLSSVQTDQGGWVCTIRGVRRRQQIEEALRSSELRYRRLFEAAKDGILILNANSGRIMDVNPFLMEMLGYSHSQLVGKRLWEIGPFKDVAACQTAFQELRHKEYIRYENLPLQASNGRSLAVEFVSNVYQVNRNRIIQCNIRDISERQRAEHRLRQLAASDPLTGLANYRHFVASLDKEISRSGRVGRQFAVLMVDVDELKKTNDRHGHTIGSQVLCRLAAVLLRSCRTIDTVARFGGDEFAVVLPETQHDAANSVVRRICHGVSNDGKEPRISVSAGAAVYPVDGETVDALLEAADAAMYAMKRQK